ncbi:hypothetical protein JCM3770_003205 [Rhodotorula araucariae]
MRHFCHECQYEGDSAFPSNADGPVCPECRGSFVEEIPEDDGAIDDPRDFDPDDGPDPDLPFFLGTPPGAAPAVLRFQLPGGGGAVVTAAVPGLLGNNGAGARGLNPLTMAMLQAFGMPGPPPPGDSAGQAGQGQGGDGAQTGPAGHGAPHHQVPIRNLATFLGEAFGPATPHPADDPNNNPFAEGGHEREHRDSSGDGGDSSEAHAPGGGAGGPLGGGLNFLGALLNAFGLNGAGGAAGGFGLPANMGDYALGEGGFQQILNDLMEQAAGRAGPQPAPDDMIDKLPRVKITQELLDMDTVSSCAICQDNYILDETAIALPCKPTNHLYHEDCIVPWLKTSGTCPTCRFALVPQPGQPGYGEPDPATASAPAAGGVERPARAEASTSTARPPLPRISSLNPESPATARIPEVDGGSSLPGSWVWPDAGDAEAAADDPEDMDVDAVDPARAAREAAERRAERERRERECAASQEPTIEDVD